MSEGYLKKPVQQSLEDYIYIGRIRGLATQSTGGLQSDDGFFGQEGLGILIPELSEDVAISSFRRRRQISEFQGDEQWKMYQIIFL
ncbi:MAG: hypothetical protein NPIRA03_34740 [Nitrospirales bacterium]|nr:MAG: hypothetical protein NPIRA03_34740 [Nitrospirales bacterium]